MRLLVFSHLVLPSSIDVSSLTLKSFLFVMTSSTFSGPCCVTQGMSSGFQESRKELNQVPHIDCVRRSCNQLAPTQTSPQAENKSCCILFM